MRLLRLLLPLAPLSLAAVGVVRAATLVVPDQYSTVQAALGVAASGDTVFVRAGTYDESLSLFGKDLVVRGESDGTVLTTAMSGRILDLGSGVTSSTVLEHLIFRSGQSAFAACLYAHDGATPTIRYCRFLNNRAQVPSGASLGGALGLDPGCRAVLDSCSFVNNFANSLTLDQCFGGAIVLSSGSSLTADRCRFQNNVAAGFEGGSGGAIAAFEDAQAIIRDCEFVSNSAGIGGAIWVRGGLTLEHCRFTRNGGAYGAAALQSNGDRNAVSIVGNVFVDNEAIGAYAVEVVGPGELTSNTIAFNGALTGAGGLVLGTGLHAERNMVVENAGIGVECVDNAFTFACNNVWANGPCCGTSDYGACGNLSGIDGNDSADPLFCDPANRILTLMPNSPFGPSSPCGVVGALGVDCPPTGVASLPPPGLVARLLPTRPHPARLPVRFAFELARASKVRLEVFDLLGRRLVTVLTAEFDAGPHEATWDGAVDGGTRVGAGFYVAVLDAGGVRDTRRFLLVR